MHEAEVFGRIGKLESEQAGDKVRIEHLEEDITDLEARIDARLDRIEAWAGRIFWALAIGAAGLLGQLGVFWVKKVKEVPGHQVETYLQASESNRVIHTEKGE